MFIKDFRSKTVQLAGLGIQTIQQHKCEPQNSPCVAPEVQEYTGIPIINLQGCMPFVYSLSKLLSKTEE